MQPFSEWLETHCYDCGRLTSEPGPRDVDHVLCFVGRDDLTPEQRDRLTLVYTVEERPRWKQEGYPSVMAFIEAYAR